MNIHDEINNYWGKGEPIKDKIKVTCMINSARRELLDWLDHMRKSNEQYRIGADEFNGMMEEKIQSILGREKK